MEQTATGEIYASGQKKRELIDIVAGEIKNV